MWSILVDTKGPKLWKLWYLIFIYLIVLFLTIYPHRCIFLFAMSPASHCVANVEKFVIIIFQFFAGTWGNQDNKLCFLLRYIFSERHFNVHFKYFYFSNVSVLSYFLLRILATYNCFLLNYLKKKSLCFQHLYCRCKASLCLSYTFFKWNYLIHVLWYSHISRQERVILLVFVQGVCKIFAQTSRVSSSDHKKKVHINTCSEMSVFSLIERLLSTVNTFIT
jgi:hypothetical protein